MRCQRCAPRTWFRYLTNLSFFCLCLLAAKAAAASWVELKYANLTVTAVGRAPVVENVNLPFHWDRVVGAIPGTAVAQFEPMVLAAGEIHAIYIPRLGNSYAVRVNDEIIAHSGSVPIRASDGFSSDPVFVSIPSAMAGRWITLSVEFGASGHGKYPGLSTVFVGNADELSERFAKRRFWESDTRIVIAGVTALLGLFGMLLWARERDPVYLYYGMAELLWTVLTARTLFRDHFLPEAWWKFVFYDLPLNLAPLLIYRAVLSMLGRNLTPFDHVLRACLCVAGPLAAWAAFGDARWATQGWSLLLIAFLLILTQVSCIEWRKDKSLEKFWIVSVLVLLILTTFNDFFNYLNVAQSYVATVWLRFSWLLFGMAFASLIAGRLAKATEAIAKMNQTLSARLALRNAELEAAFERDRRAEKERGVVEERARLVQDLHDGLGSQLVGALRIAQQAQSSKADVILQLRGAIDQMKLAVDAIHEPDGDIATLLGAVRYRLAPRLEAAGIQLHWSVAELPAVPNWGAAHSHQLQMILLEVFTNMMVHAQARQAWVSAQAPRDFAQPNILIQIEDNGIGFDVDREDAFGKGLANMKARATRIGFALSVTSAPGRTVTVLSLKIGAATTMAHLAMT